ncbi:MAG: heterodisulfide reductase-related iron-sulfur binding cluster [Myxococcota bacterium]
MSRSEETRETSGDALGSAYPRPGDSLRAAYAGTLDCVHCGLCLPVCPTYRETGRETSSPRGRVYLMRGVAEGRIPLGPAVAEEAYLCLGCRACETACPSGVRYGALLEETRGAVERAGLREGGAKRFERFALRRVLPHRGRLALAVRALRVLQRTGAGRLAGLLPPRLADAWRLLPEIPPSRARRRLPRLVPAEGKKRGRVALFEGCLMPELFGPVNAATARVLARNGFEVVVPEAQGCCGALHRHAGDPDFAHALEARNTDAFGGADAIVVNSAGCSAVLREGALAPRVRDVCELLDAEGLVVEPPRHEGTLCYDDPCHLVHAQGVADAPRRLLAQVPGLTLLTHDDPTSCCGAAGIYNLTHPEMSRTVLDRKMKALAAAAPDWIASGNPGCLMQLAAGARDHALRARVVHPVELL